MDTVEAATSAERLLIMKAEQRNIPINGSMELLPLCNMNCDMCYVRLSRAEMEARGRIRTGEEWLALGRQMARAGTLFLLLTGGEPLLHPDFREIYLGLKKMGMILTINTNATLLDEEWADFFAAHKPRRINITLYGASSDAYEKLCHHRAGFERVINAVRLLRQRGVDVKLAGSITPANAADVPRMLEIAEELDVPMRMDTYMMPAARERTAPFIRQNRLMPENAAKVRVYALRREMGEETFARYRTQILQQIDGYVPREPKPCFASCHAGKCSFTVNWQGELRTCVVLTQPSVPVFEVGFAAAWEQVSREFQETHYCPQCSACRLRPVCRTCTAAPLLETGDYLETPEYLCRYAAETERLLRLTLGEKSHE